MSPLNEEPRSDKEELVGKAVHMDNFMDDVNENTRAEVTHANFNHPDKRGSIWITVRSQSSDDEPPECPDYRRQIRMKNRVIAKLGLTLVFVAIILMAVFAFLTLKNHHHDHHMDANGILRNSDSGAALPRVSSNITNLAGTTSMTTPPPI